MSTGTEAVIPQRYWAWGACILASAASLHVPDKAERIYNFHRNTLVALKELLAAAGLSHPSELGPEHVVRRVSSNEVRLLATLHPWLKPGELLSGVPDQAVYQVFWASSRSDSFAASENMLAARASKSR